MPTLRFVRDRSGEAAPQPGRGEPVPFVAVTAGIKGDGIDTADLPWSFGRGEERPGGWYRYPLLWVHDFGGQRLPLGVTDVRMRNDGTTMEANAIFDPEDAFAVEVERKYLSDVGGLRGFSASWDDIDAAGIPVRGAGGRAVAHELLEVSAVPVGMDPLAIKEKRADALRSMARELIAALEESGAEPDSDAAAEVAAATCEDCAGGEGCACDDEPADCQGCGDCAACDAATAAEPDDSCGGSGVCEDCDAEDAADDEGARDAVAAEMVAVFSPATDDSDATRSRRYRALLPAYRRLGWTAPELLPAAELAALDGDVWRGLFVSGELERLERVGKELSAANLAGLRDALAQLEAGCDALRTMVQRVESGRDRGAAEPAPAELSPEDIARAIIDSLSVRIERA